MLIEFSVENYRSFGERQTLSMVASAAKELRETNCYESTIGLVLTRSAAIYGPNASGKSNLLRALGFMGTFVDDSARGQSSDLIDVQPFAFERDKEKPTRLEVQFLEEGVRYQYGFEVNQKVVVAEWLNAYPQGRAQLWFERRRTNEQTTLWKFGRRLPSSQAKIWREATRPNALLLSTASQLNAEQFGPIFRWLTYRLRTIAPASFMSDFTSQRCSDDSWKQLITKVLLEADVGISDFTIEKQSMASMKELDRLPAEIKAAYQDAYKGQEQLKPRFKHRADNGNEFELDFEEESAGTQKFFMLAGPWIHTLTENLVLLVDELDTSMHPLLTRKLLSFFHRPPAKEAAAQLIFSTHDTTILDPAILRRDQVWFVEKDSSLQSRVYPLTDFSPRKGERFEKGYLDGRYGALPFIGAHHFE